MYREYTSSSSTHIRQSQALSFSLPRGFVVMEALKFDLVNMSMGGDKKVALVTGATGEPSGCVKINRFPRNHEKE